MKSIFLRICRAGLTFQECNKWSDFLQLRSERQSTRNRVFQELYLYYFSHANLSPSRRAKPGQSDRKSAKSDLFREAEGMPA
jgi:hypothetical protein